MRLVCIVRLPTGFFSILAAEGTSCLDVTKRNAWLPTGDPPCLSEKEAFRVAHGLQPDAVITPEFLSGLDPATLPVVDEWYGVMPTDVTRERLLSWAAAWDVADILLDECVDVEDDMWASEIGEA